MDESGGNSSADDTAMENKSGVKVKPKKRSLVERELETSLTARITSPITSDGSTNTSRYGRARRLKSNIDFCDTEKAVTKVLQHQQYSKTPSKSPPAYKMHASNSPVKIESPRSSLLESNLENQIENIYNANISLSRFGSEHKRKASPSPAKKFPKVYMRKDLIQTKEKEKEETITLIKNLFSPVKSAQKQNHLNNILERSSEKYSLNSTVSKQQNGYLDTSSVVKALDFDSNSKKKKVDVKDRVVKTNTPSKSDIFDMEAKCPFQVGDLAWARFGTYPFWPCIVTREPGSELFVKKKLFGKTEHDIIHVTFLYDNGRRNWIIDNMLRKYQGLTEFENARDSFTPEAKKKDPRLYQAFFISDKKLVPWHTSIEEADMLQREPKRFRIDILNELLGRNVKSNSNAQKSGKITRTDSDVSLSESLYDTLFSLDDRKNDDPDKSRTRSRKKSLDVSEVVTACLDNMAAKSGMANIQKQSHMDRWLQKAKSKTPEKSQFNISISVERIEKDNTKEKDRNDNNKGSSFKKKKKPVVVRDTTVIKPYSLRKSTTESQNLRSYHNEHDYSKIDKIETIATQTDETDLDKVDNTICVIDKVESICDEKFDNTDQDVKPMDVSECVNDVTEENELIANDPPEIDECMVNDAFANIKCIVNDVNEVKEHLSVVNDDNVEFKEKIVINRDIEEVNNVKESNEDIVNDVNVNEKMDIDIQKEDDVTVVNEFIVNEKSDESIEKKIESTTIASSVELYEKEEKKGIDSLPIDITVEVPEKEEKKETLRSTIVNLDVVSEKENTVVIDNPVEEKYQVSNVSPKAVDDERQDSFEGLNNKTNYDIQSISEDESKNQAAEKEQNLLEDKTKNDEVEELDSVSGKDVQNTYEKESPKSVEDQILSLIDDSEQNLVEELKPIRNEKQNLVDVESEDLDKNKIPDSIKNKVLPLINEQQASFSKEKKQNPNEHIQKSVISEERSGTDQDKNQQNEDDIQNPDDEVTKLTMMNDEDYYYDDDDEDDIESPMIDSPIGFYHQEKEEKASEKNKNVEAMDVSANEQELLSQVTDNASKEQTNIKMDMSIDDSVSTSTNNALIKSNKNLILENDQAIPQQDLIHNHVSHEIISNDQLTKENLSSVRREPFVKIEAIKIDNVTTNNSERVLRKRKDKKISDASMKQNCNKNSVYKSELNEKIIPNGHLEDGPHDSKITHQVPIVHDLTDSTTLNYDVPKENGFFESYDAHQFDPETMSINSITSSISNSSEYLPPKIKDSKSENIINFSNKILRSAKQALPIEYDNESMSSLDEITLSELKQLSEGAKERTVIRKSIENSSSMDSVLSTASQRRMRLILTDCVLGPKKSNLSVVREISGNTVQEFEIVQRSEMDKSSNNLKLRLRKSGSYTEANVNCEANGLNNSFYKDTNADSTEETETTPAKTSPESEKSPKKIKLRLRKCISRKDTYVNSDIVINGFYGSKTKIPASHVAAEFEETELIPNSESDQSSKKRNSQSSRKSRSSTGPKIDNVFEMNGFYERKTKSPDCFIKEAEFDTISIASTDSGASIKRNGKKQTCPDMEEPEFVQYLELKQDSVMDDHPELSQDEIVAYLYKTWQYEESLKSDHKKDDEIKQSNLIKGVSRTQEVPKKKKTKKRSVGKDIRHYIAKECRKAQAETSQANKTPRQFEKSDVSTVKDVPQASPEKPSPKFVNTPIVKDIVDTEEIELVPAKRSPESKKSPKKRKLRLRKSYSPPEISKEVDQVDLTEAKPASPNCMVKEVEPDTISINSTDSGTSTRRKTKKHDYPKMEEPEFLKYLEMRQDSLIDEHPELTKDEIVAYLYKTWQYEENLKSEEIKNDDIQQSTIIKGINVTQTPPKKKKAQKTRLINIDKIMSKETKTSPQDVKPRELPKRITVKPFYKEEFSDIEDEIQLFEIFKTDKSRNEKETPIVKKEVKQELIDATNKTEAEKSVVAKPAPKADPTKIEPENEVDTKETIELIDDEEFYDEEEMYFEQLTKPKPNVFKGLVREKVCEICEKTSNLVKCKSCNGMFHVDCVNKVEEVVQVPAPVRGRKKKKILRGRKPKISTESNDESQSDEKQGANVSEENMSVEEIKDPEPIIIIDLDSFEEQLSVKMQEMIEKAPVINYDSFESDDDLDWEKTEAGKCEIVDVKLRPKQQPVEDFKCKSCQEHDTPICFVCKSAVSPRNKIDKRQKCQVAHCHKYFHLECLEHWPQTQFNSGEPSRNNKKIDEHFEALTCPRHVCHTCVCDDPRGCKTRFSGDKLARCVRCPATYHSFNKCLPAGSRILSASHIVCPRHYEHRPGKVPCHVNTGWCFICALGGTLICCEYCPTSFHADCLNIEPPEGNYMCEDCETGRLPLYGEMVWVKLGHYRWWPGIILHPSEIPDNILAVKHSLGEFVVRFFGQYDHYWVNRGRVFPFQEGDSGRLSGQKSKIDDAFIKAMEHARRAFDILKNVEPNDEENQDIASSLLPPHYVKLKVNKPCGALYGKKIDIEESSLTQCECNPDVEDPCGPYSHCLNRMLLTECGPTCRAGERCQNRAFEKRQYPKLVPYRTPHRGWGLKTLEDVKAGQFVIEYVGELIDEAEFQRRMRRKHEMRDENYYFLTLDKERMIDAGPKGNLARFMNHCCEPNCETQKWTVLGDVRVGLFAIHDIPANAEVNFNYNLECAGIEKKQCMCGAKRCSGYIGAKPKQDEPQSKKSKMPVKRVYKKRKNTTESPSTSNTLIKPKRPVGRPPKPRELTDIEKDLLIINNATNGILSDSEGSGRLSIENEKKDPKALKRKRVSFSTEDIIYNDDTNSPSVKKLKLDDEKLKLDNEKFKLDNEKLKLDNKKSSEVGD